MKSLSAFLSVLIIIVIAVVIFYFFGTPPPSVSLTPEGGPVAAARTLTLKVQSRRASLKSIGVTAQQGERNVTVMTKEYPTGIHDATETFTLQQAGLKDGPFTLRITAGTSRGRFGAGRSSAQIRSFDFSSTPPSVEVLSTAHNITRGGAGLVVYTVSKEVEKTGVVFADRFFPGYRQSGSFYACLFPYPHDADPGQYIPKVTAVDRAGNERVVTINYHLLPKNFSTDTIKISDAFLDKIASEFKNRFPQAATPLEIFLKANRDLRQEDKKLLDGYGRQTSPVPVWQGVFFRMPNAAPLGGYAQTRSYVYQGQKVDQQTHMGFDLASVAHAPVPAANRGKVVYAGELGIYGQCVVIDHGMGLQSLYGHLSQITVKGGDSVEKEQVIGHTGATGMAAGDHLHFEILVSGEPVNPIEWWDPSWIKNNVTSKLELIKGR